MRVPRIRIAWIMAAVVFAALDFAGIRALDDLHGGKILMLGAMPIANVLVASLLVGYLRSEDRAFLHWRWVVWDNSTDFVHCFGEVLPWPKWGNRILPSIVFLDSPSKGNTQ